MNKIVDSFISLQFQWIPTDIQKKNFVSLFYVKNLFLFYFGYLHHPNGHMH